MRGKLDGRVAIVTGTSPNIGGGLAAALAAAGATIVAVDANEANARDCAKDIAAAGGRALGLACDVTDEGQVAKVVATVCERFGYVDVLVNNAATFNRKGLLTTSLAEWRKQCAVMLDGAFLFSRHAAERMVERKRGVIINIISTAGHQGEPGNIAYSTCKSALLNFTRAAAMDLSPHGVRVVSLTPTATAFDEMRVRAERWGHALDLPPNLDELMQPFVRGIPLGRLPRPSDYGAAAVFLASDDAAMITGTDLRVDAGAVGRYWAWTPGA